MKTLFDDLEDPVSKHNNGSLKIVEGKGKPLSKSQEKFNHLVKKIEIQNLRLEQERKKYDKLYSEYNKKIPLQQKKYAQIEIETAKAFAETCENLKINSRQKKEVEMVIRWLCKRAFTTIEPDEETKAFYNYWSSITYEEELNEHKESMKEILASDLRLKYGIDLDLSDFENTPEGFARLKERIQNELGNQEQKNEEKKRKTKKQAQKENKLKKEESDKLKGLRNIYLSLAKMLHPDTVTDEKEKLMKEELMKKLTVAYNEKNLSELLKLEVQWISSESSNPEKLSEDKLKMYIANLQEQLTNLEIEMFELRHNSRYDVISDFAGYSEKNGLHQINELAKSFESQISAYKRIINTLSRNPDKKVLSGFVNEFIEIIESSNFI